MGVIKLTDDPKIDPDMLRAAIREVPRERWATVLGMIFVQQQPVEALQQIALEGRRKFVKTGLKTDIVGLKAEDYGDIYTYIVMAVQHYNQSRVAINLARAQSQQPQGE